MIAYRRPAAFSLGQKTHHLKPDKLIWWGIYVSVTLTSRERFRVIRASWTFSPYLRLSSVHEVSQVTSHSPSIPVAFARKLSSLPSVVRYRPDIAPALMVVASNRNTVERQQRGSTTTNNKGKYANE
jgi:hypothetical protein